MIHLHIPLGSRKKKRVWITKNSNLRLPSTISSLPIKCLKYFNGPNFLNPNILGASQKLQQIALQFALTHLYQQPKGKKFLKKKFFSKQKFMAFAHHFYFQPKHVDITREYIVLGINSIQELKHLTVMPPLAANHVSYTVIPSRSGSLTCNTNFVYQTFHKEEG